jgi:uncharacterized membrane protein HdeD (DUF308 family)
MTLALGWFFLVGGFVRIAQSIQLRREMSGWAFVSAIASFALGLYMIATFASLSGD